MKLGSREICDVVFRAKSTQKIGNKTFYTGQPVLVLDTAKTSTLEGNSETTYATGGKGNSNLIAWDGSKTVTFTVEDALISPIGLSILMGADIADTTGGELVHVHKMGRFEVKKNETGSAIADNDGGSTSIAANGLYIELENFYKETAPTAVSSDATKKQYICMSAPLFAMGVEQDNSLTGEFIEKNKLTLVTHKGSTDSSGTYTRGSQYLAIAANTTLKDLNGTPQPIKQGDVIHIDCYVIRSSANVSELQVRKDKFAGYFYVEAETLYRRQDSGADLPAVITIPKVKIQSNFSFSMSADGDPSTFSFVMDAFPDKTYFDPTKEVLAVIQIIDDDDAATEEVKTVMEHDGSSEVVSYTKDGQTYGYSDSFIGTDEASTTPKYDKETYNS